MPRPSFIDNSFINEAIRINHAGEYGACIICKWQMRYADPEIYSILKEIETEEQSHLDFFSNEMNLRRIRPTVLIGVWHLFGVLTGVISGKLGSKFTMNCINAIETVIDKHYQGQIDVLNKDFSQDRLLDKIKQFQSEEIHHRDLALNSFGDTDGRITDKVFYKIVETFCKVAIKIT